MPILTLNASAKLTMDQKVAFRAGVADILPLIPGKVEANLMVVVNDGVTIFKAGALVEQGAYADMRLFHEAATEGKAAFTAAFFRMVADVLGFAPKDVQLTIREFSSWGAGGSYLE